jgi:hypothetical protein
MVVSGDLDGRELRMTGLGKGSEPPSVDELRTGSELLDDFFARLGDQEGIDGDMSELLQTLYSGGTLSQEAVLSGLSKLRRQDG